MEVAPRYKLLTLLALFILWKLLDTTKTLECMPIYDRVAPVVETVQWRSNFQSGSRVLKKGVMNYIFIFIYGIQCDLCRKAVKIT